MTNKEASEELKEEFEIFKTYIRKADWDNPNEELKKIIEANTMAIEVLGQQPCEDCISRKEAIKEFQVYREYDSNRTNDDWVDRIELVLADLPSVTPIISQKETVEDCISRADVLALAEKGTLVSNGNYKSVCKAINELPSVQSTRPKGKWLAAENEEMNIVGYYCSSCDLPMETEDKTAFCPNCGVRMAESEDKE